MKNKDYYLGEALRKREKKMSGRLSLIAALIFWGNFIVIGLNTSWTIAISILMMIFTTIIILRQKYIFIDRFSEES